MTAKLSVVVGTYNRLSQIQRCVNSVFRETTIPVMVYVTDAGSTDGTVEYLKANASDRLKPMLVGQRLGQARAYNNVFDIVETEFVCWLSDDNELVNGALDVAIRALERDRRLGMVGLKTKDVEGPFVDFPYIGGISSIGILNINQGVLPTAVLRQVGGFSEAFRDYGIDPDLTAKILFSGYDLALTRSVGLLHYRNWETDPSSAMYAKLSKLQEQYQRKYKLKYQDFARGGASWYLKKAFWRLLQKALAARANVNAPNTLLGRLPRDWNNIFAGRYVNLLEALMDREEAIYLRQHCPRTRCPKRLPPDPAPFEAELLHTR
jgi:GT2 family glycosyltransferase